MEQFDLVVIGGGPGGYTAAIQAAKLGLRTALVEKGELGGTCLNRGCIPTKAMLHAAELYRQIGESKRFGISVSNVKVDFKALLEYQKGIVAQLVQGVEQLLKSNGVTQIQGTGTLLARKRVRVVPENGERILSADNVLLATGSKPKKLSLPGMDIPGVLDSDGLFLLEDPPESLGIIGGGAIGVEFAEMFSTLGCRVVILEAQPRLLQNMDREIGQNLRMILKKRNVELHLGVSLQCIAPKKDGLVCTFLEKGQEAFINVQYVLCAVGRQPNMERLFEKNLLVQKEHGYIAVDQNFQTSMEGVYAIGDLVEGAQLAHVASAQGLAVAEHLAGKEPSADLTVIPQCVYTSPEIAAIGLSEEMANEQGISVDTGKALMSSNGRSLIARDERGFVKIVASKQNGRILGAQLMCARATDMIGEFASAITNQLTVRQLQRAVRAHPTYNEGVSEALDEVYGEAIHAIPKER